MEVFSLFKKGKFLSFASILLFKLRIGQESLVALYGTKKNSIHIFKTFPANFGANKEKYLSMQEGRLQSFELIFFKDLT